MWTVVAAEPGDRAGEFHLRSLSKRLDALGEQRRRWEGHEYLRAAPDGVRKRYPGGGDMDILLFADPGGTGARWRATQGECEVAARGAPCPGPRGNVSDCLVVVCRLGRPATTVVTSTYARGVGMVRQEIDLVPIVPAIDAAGGLMPTEAGPAGHSL